MKHLPIVVRRAIAKHIISTLNEIHAQDPSVLAALIENRVPCNDALSEHPTVQVEYRDPKDPDMGCKVGFLGILNGVLGTIPGTQIGYITADFEKDGTLIDFQMSKPKAYGQHE